MKRLLALLALVVLLAACGSGKSIGYTHKPLAAEGCAVSFSACRNDGQLRIIVTVKSDRLVFDNNPTMVLKNFKGEELKLEGVNYQEESRNRMVAVGKVFIPITELNASAEFPIEEKDINFFASGISLIHLSTIPIVHEKEFANDVIGSSLYSSLQKATVSSRQ